MMMKRLVYFVFILALWLLLSSSLDLQHLVAGVLVAFLVTVFTGDMFINRPHLLKSPARYLWFAYYIPLFVWECFKANIDVAYRVVHPRRPIRPGIVKVKTRLKSEIGLTFLANSITLTPGTMSVDIDKENGFLYIHWINVKDDDIDKATAHIVTKFEDVLERIFE